MPVKLFKLLLATLLLGAFLLKAIPSLDNNFYFTMDQGDDAVALREILTQRVALLRGPETGIQGVYTGPFWYYFISLGYILLGGHPYGAVLMLSILSVITTAILVWKLKDTLSPAVALLIGGALQLFWWYHDASRYAFNPFPIVFFSILIIFFLGESLTNRKPAFVLAGALVGLCFHAEIAVSVVLLAIYSIVGLVLILKKPRPIKTLLMGLLVLSLFFLPHLFAELSSDFSQTNSLLREFNSSQGVFAQKSLTQLNEHFLGIVADSTFPQNKNVGIVLFSAVFVFYLVSSKKKNARFTNYIIFLSLIFFLLSWLWFSQNRGWKVWHTSSLPPLLFLSLLLMTLALPQWISKILLVVFLLSQIVYFGALYRHFFRPNEDQSLLKNQLSAIDWVYHQSGGEGFSVYSYLPSVRDFPYQYLFWWYGKNKYSYLPCEYSRFPKIPPYYVVDWKRFQGSDRPCPRLRFLIIEPDPNWAIRDQWYKEVSEGSFLLGSSTVGKIGVEMRQIDVRRER